MHKRGSIFKKSTTKNVPSISVPRSGFLLEHNRKTCMVTGKLYPIMWRDIVPGDTFEGSISNISWLTTPIFPVMDRMILDVYVFFVPWRQVWSDCEKHFGENRQGSWASPAEYQKPKISAPPNGWSFDSLADHLRCRPGVPNPNGTIVYDHIPFRAYAAICDDFFRNQAYRPALFRRKDSNTVVGRQLGQSGYDPVQHLDLGGELYDVNRLSDYFSDALPEPQKGQEVLLPIGQYAPVVAANNVVTPSSFPIMFSDAGQSVVNGVSQPVLAHKGAELPYRYTSTNQQSVSPASNGALYPNNLYAQLNTATAASVGALRDAVQVQLILEAKARSGTRYPETIKSMFGVDVPMLEVDRPEFLGSHRFPLRFIPVPQTSSTDPTSPQANLSSYALAHGSSGGDFFKKSFTQHGTFMALACLRGLHSYEQGEPQDFFRFREFDSYNPRLANIAEQPIKNKEIYRSGTPRDEEWWGCLPAWEYYRHGEASVTGLMRKEAPFSLGAYHLGDLYSAPPYNSEAWQIESPVNVDSVLTVPSTQNVPHLRVEFDLQIKAFRPMPTTSVPNHLDHIIGWR